MLYLSEVHAVIGEHERAFEDCMKEAYLTSVPADSGARLLWYLDSTHGAGEGYKVLTVAGFADAAAYARHLDRVLKGDLAAWMRHADSMRYEVRGNLLVDAALGNGTGADLAVPIDGREHSTAVLRWDVLRPEPGVDLLAAARERAHQLGTESGAVLQLERAFVPALAAVEDDALVLCYRMLDLDAWVDAWDTDVTEWSGGLGRLPGTASRQTRLLRTSVWSPLA